MSSTTSRSASRGQTLVLFVGGLVAMLLVATLAFDVGMGLVERRDQQNAADAAALAGARFVMTAGAFDGPCVSAGGNQAASAACNIAVENGFVDADAAEDVLVHIPPVHGRFTGLDGFVEVEIKATRPSIFAGVIGKAGWDVSAYAVATNHQDLTFPFSMLALNPTKCKALQVSGTGVINAYGNIQSNSNGGDCTGDPIGFSRTGGSTINVYADDATCRSVSEIQDQGSGSMTCTQAENSFALPDPLRGLAAPPRPPLADPMTYVTGSSPTPPPSPPKNCPGGTPAPSLTAPVMCKLAPTGAYSGMAWILQPGLYPGGLEITANTTAYLMPGVYWIGGGGLRVATGGSIFTIAHTTDAAPTTATATWGGGVLLYNSQLLDDTGTVISAGGPIDLNGSAATMKLKMLDLPLGNPYSVYNKMVIFQDRALTTSVTLNGSASTTEVDGIIYVPNGLVKLNGNGGTLVVDQIIADSYLIDGGGGNITIRRNVGIDAVIVAAGLVD